MSRLSRLAPLLVLLCCTFAHAESSTASQAVVDDLNAHYKNTAAECGQDPAYYCSGVLVRTVDYSSAYKFWTHSPDAAVLESSTFNYLRADIGTRSLSHNTGFIFSDQNKAIADNKAQTLRCIYPFTAGTQSNGRPENGCGFATTRHNPKQHAAQRASQDADQSSCYTLNPPAITLDLWKANFERHGSVTKNQCSLSTQDASQFHVSLQAHNAYNSLMTGPDEVLVENWEPTAPQTLPIVAFFYNANTPAKRDDAMKLQADYQAATGMLLPVVRLDLYHADRNVFSLPPSPPDGAALAAELNRRYDKVDDSCNGNPAYYCDGVLTRVIDWASTYKVWNPSPTAVSLGAVSFSYLRHDLNIRELAYNQPQEEGIIFKDLDTAIRDGDHPMRVLCSYPTDAASVVRANNGCGAHRNYPSSSGYCSAQNITTVEQWWAHYSAVAGSGSFSARNEHQCSFLGSSASAFAVSLAAHRRLPGTETQWHNELMLQVWPQNIPLELPLQAIFYHLREVRGTGLTGARNIQRDYLAATGQILPIVRITLANGASPFTYVAADQAVTAP